MNNHPDYYIQRNIYKYVAIKAHYLFRQSKNTKSLMITKEDWKHYEFKIKIIQNKIFQYIIKKNPNFDYGKDTLLHDIDFIYFYVDYETHASIKAIDEDNKNIKKIRINLSINSNPNELKVNEISKI